jgi:hypothetical protein
MGINSCVRSKPSDSSLFWQRLFRGRKINATQFQLLLEYNIWPAWLLVFLPPKLSVVLKINILHQSKDYKNHFENSHFWGMWPLGHVGHVTYSVINMLFISTGFFLWQAPLSILSVGTTANSPFKWFRNILWWRHIWICHQI